MMDSTIYDFDMYAVSFGWMHGYPLTVCLKGLFSFVHTCMLASLGAALLCKHLPFIIRIEMRHDQLNVLPVITSPILTP